MSWNYRIVKYRDGKPYSGYGLHEVFYDDDSKPWTMTEQECKRLDWILTKCQAAPENALTEWEDGFVNDMTERLEKYGKATRLSERQ